MSHDPRLGPAPTMVELASGPTLAVRRFEPHGPPTGVDIVLTHGLASNATLWSGVAGRLADAGHRVAIYDQRGHGRSSKPDSGYDMATVADDLAHLIDAIGFDRPVIGGQSWGGNVVLEAAHRHRDALSGAVLVDGGFLHLRRRFPRWDDCRDALAPPPLAGTPLRQITDWIESMAHDWPAEGRAATLANFEVLDDGTVSPWLTFDRHLAVLRGLWEHEPSTRYADLDVPILIIAAAGSAAERAAKQDAVDEAIEALPNGSATWFQPAHHDVHAQKPEAVTAVVAEFVARHS